MEVLTATHLATGVNDNIGIEPQDSCHCPRSGLARLEHEFATAPDETSRVGHRQRPSHRVRTVLSQRVARRHQRFDPVANHGVDSEGVRQDGWLRIVREGELILGPVPHDTGQLHPQRCVHLPEDRTCLGKPLRDVPPHP